MEVEVEVPEMLVKEARMCTETPEEAKEYAAERIDSICLRWPTEQS